MNRAFSFMTDTVKKVGGLKATLVLNDFKYLIDHAKARGPVEENYNYQDGRYWTYCTLKELEVFFDGALTLNDIRGAISKLLKDGFIEKASHNDVPFDRTTWYTLTDKGEEVYVESSKSMCENHKSDLLNSQIRNVNSTNVPYTINNTIDNTIEDTPEPLPFEPEPDDGFETFWQAYPKKVSKQDAQKAWRGLMKAGMRPGTRKFDDLMDGLEAWKRSQQWEDKQYIPYPATFLRQHRWEEKPQEGVHNGLARAMDMLNDDNYWEGS